jgi:hypothetical protein
MLHSMNGGCHRVSSDDRVATYDRGVPTAGEPS